jgi:SAM-dependent methyltransferase
VRVTMAVTPTDDTAAITKQFEFRGWTPTFTAIESASQLPFAKGEFDLAYVNALHDETFDLARTVAELQRVLKPGGKLFALIPAWYDWNRLQRYVMPLPRLQPEAFGGPNLTGREVREQLTAFTDIRITKRHLRRPKLPWLDRLVGRVLAVRAFKPIVPSA